MKIKNLELGDFPLLLAPMEDVSDPPFRTLCKQGGADLMYTEFISSEGLIRSALKSKKKTDIWDHERPLGIQLFGGDPDTMHEATLLVTEANPDLIDINFGCPVKAVACKGAGAALLQDIPKMIHLTKRVVNATHLPVTVKTRLGWDEKTILIEEIAERLQDVGIQALTIHGRTRKQMYKGHADWTFIGKIKNNPRIHIPIIGNGDIDSSQKAKEYKMRYGVDAIMIGRAAIGNPWIFNHIKTYLQTGENPDPPSIQNLISTIHEHLHLSVLWKGERTGILEMRRHYAKYFKGYPHFKPFLMQLVRGSSADEIQTILNKILTTYTATQPLVSSPII